MVKSGNVNNILSFAGRLEGANIDWEEKVRRMKNLRKSFSNRLNEPNKNYNKKA